MPEFRFSLPAITALYNDQQLAYNPRHSVLVTGGPGSGKTVVTIFRFLRAIGEEQEIMLFTFNRTLIYTIRGMLKASAEELFGELNEDQIDDIVKNRLSTFYQWHKDNVAYFNEDEDSDVMGENFRRYIRKKRSQQKFDELFYDEGQDLPGNVYNNTFDLSEVVTVGADRAQNYREFYPPDEVEDIILDNLRKQFRADQQYLGGNYRNARQIFDLAKNFVPDDLRVQDIDSSELSPGNRPEIRIGLSHGKQMDLIIEIIENNPNSNIGILVHFGNEVETIKNELISNGYRCDEDAPVEKSFSYYYNEMSAADEEVLKRKFRTPFITTYESCKGLEFDIVIMALFELSNKAMITKNRSDRFYATRSHYYVAVTRARNDIFILCNRKPDVLDFYNENAQQDILEGL